MDIAWVGVVGTLAGALLGYGGQALQAGRQRTWQQEDLDRQDALRRESELRLIRLGKYEEFSAAASRALLLFMQRTQAEAEAEAVPGEGPEKPSAIAKLVAVMEEGTKAFGGLMGVISTIEFIAGADVRNAADAVSAWLTDAMTRDASEGWGDVLTSFSPLLDHCRDAMRRELAGG